MLIRTIWDSAKIIIIAILFFRISKNLGSNFYKNHLLRLPDILTLPEKSQNEKMSEILAYNAGNRDILNGINLIKRYIPEGASILVPPQRLNFAITGNNAFFRWFILPRLPISGSLDSIQATPLYKIYIKESPKFVLIAPGKDIPFLEEDNIGFWPNFKIKSKKIILRNSISQLDTIIQSDFDPAVYREKYLHCWGLIFL